MATYLGKAPARLAIVTDDSVTSAKIVDNTVTSADILNATITGADLASDISITTSGNLSLSDSSTAYFGDDNDLSVYHNGSTGYIAQTTGSLFIRNYANDQDIYLQSDDGSGGLTTYLTADGSTGEVQLNYYGDTKIKTTSTGVEVTGFLGIGNVAAGYTPLNTITINTSSDIPFYTHSTDVNNFIVMSDTSGSIKFGTTADRFGIFTGGDAGGSSAPSSTSHFANNAVERFSILSDGKVGIGTTSPSQDLDILNASGSNVILRDTLNRAFVICGPATGVTPRIGTTGTGSSLIVTLNSNDCFAFTAAGCLGVNTINPFFGMHVCNGTIGFDDGSAIRHGIKSIGHQIGIGRCTLDGASADCGNLAFGSGALQCNDVGQYNVAMGYQAMFNTNTAAGSYNTAHGYQALYNNTTGEKNTAVGYQSMYSNTTGEYNAAIGTDSLRSNTIGQQNVALGHNSLYCNTEGFGQVAAGYKTLFNNTTGNYNVGLGAYALEFNTTGSCNVALGYEVLKCNTTGSQNVAIGYQSMYANTTGQYNVALGYQVLKCTTIGNTNVGVGYCALFNNTTGCDNVAVGHLAARDNTTGVFNVAIGYNASLLNSIGTRNVAVGTCSMMLNRCSFCNITIGARAGYSIGREVGGLCCTANVNVLIGADAGFGMLEGNANVAVGTSNLCLNSGGCNSAVGHAILPVNTTGFANVGMGAYALQYNTTGSYNVAIGMQALNRNTTGQCNVAIGHAALYCNVSGVKNVALGHNAGFCTLSSSGVYIGECAGRTSQCTNIAIGRFAYMCGTGTTNTIIGGTTFWQSSTDSSYNVIIGGSSHTEAFTSPIFNVVSIGLESGQYACASDSIYIGRQAGQNNVCPGAIYIGMQAGRNSTTASQNVAIGCGAMYYNTIGPWNTAVGDVSLHCNTVGCGNVAIGRLALHNNTTGNFNSVVGYCAGCTLTTGSNNTVIGYNAQPSSATVCNEITLGDANVAALRIPGLNFNIDSDGIKFNGDTAAANALDDYEEGTWTPGVVGFTTSSSEGYYRKVGSQVTVWFKYTSTTNLSTSFAYDITGLPFTPTHYGGTFGLLRFVTTTLTRGLTVSLNSYETTKLRGNIFNFNGTTADASYDDSLTGMATFFIN